MLDTQNALIVGFDKTPIHAFIPDRPYLIIDDGPVIDDLSLPARRAVVHFDTNEHSFNPLKAMDYRRAVDFLAVVAAAFPEGENTLTRRYSDTILLNALLDKPTRLETLIPSSKDPYQRDAHEKIQRLLKSPVLSRVLNHPTNFSFKRTIHARLDRAKLGDFDAFVLGNLLIALYDGPVVIPDFGFYGRPHHVALMRQNRLIAGIDFFAQAPALRNDLLRIDTKIGSKAVPEDADLLALYAGKLKYTTGYHDHVGFSVDGS